MAFFNLLQRVGIVVAVDDVSPVFLRFGGTSLAEIVVQELTMSRECRRNQ